MSAKSGTAAYGGILVILPPELLISIEMKRLLAVLSFVSCQLSFSVAQTLLTLDSCRAMALRNNKQMRVAEVRRNVAADVRRSARTKYLPHVSALGAYEHTSREISLLSDAQKSALGSLGTTVAIGLQGSLATYAQMLPAAMQQQLGTDLGQAATARASTWWMRCAPTHATSGQAPSC